MTQTVRKSEIASPVVYRYTTKQEFIYHGYQFKVGDVFYGVPSDSEPGVMHMVYWDAFLRKHICSCQATVWDCKHVRGAVETARARQELHNSWQQVERAKLVEVLDSCSHQELTVVVPQPKVIQVPVLAVIVVKSILQQMLDAARQASLEAEYQNLLDRQVHIEPRQQEVWTETGVEYREVRNTCEHCGRNHHSWNCPF